MEEEGKYCSEAMKLLAGASPAPQVVRLHTRSEGADSLHPLLVTVRQVRGISSWVLPYVESGSVSDVTASYTGSHSTV